MGNTLRVPGGAVGGGWGIWEMSSKEALDVMNTDWGLYVTGESLKWNYSETNTTLSVKHLNLNKSIILDSTSRWHGVQYLLPSFDSYFLWPFFSLWERSNIFCDSTFLCEVVKSVFPFSFIDYHTASTMQPWVDTVLIITNSECKVWILLLPLYCRICGIL